MCSAHHTEQYRNTGTESRAFDGSQIVRCSQRGEVGRTTCRRYIQMEDMGNSIQENQDDGEGVV